MALAVSQRQTPPVALDLNIYPTSQLQVVVVLVNPPALLGIAQLKQFDPIVREFVLSQTQRDPEGFNILGSRQMQEPESAS